MEPIPRWQEGARSESDFVGRDPELQSIRARLAPRAVVTLVGPPGVGKTRIALELARAHPGAAVCDLTPARTVPELLQRLAHALGRPAEVGSLREALGRLPLLVLDNCEQAADAVLQALEALGGEVPVLLTSRSPVGHRAEQVIDLAPLPVGDGVRLFVQRAQAASGRFDPAAHPPSVLAELVGALDGLPLAIEMAAARTRVLSPSQLLARLKDPLALLRGGHGRWSSLSAAIAWSWDLLTEAQRSVLAQCSAFPSGFDLTAAEAVVELPPGSPPVLDLLEDLERASLLGIVAVAELEEELRFRQYQCVREFAAAHRPPGVELRHARHYAERFAQEAEDGAPPRPARLRLSLELANLQAAARAAREAEPACAVLAALGVSALAMSTGPAALGCEALAAAPLERVDDRLRLLALLRRGALRLRTGEPAAADLQAGLALARRLGDARSEAVSLCNLGLLARRAERLEEAEQLYRRGAAVAEEAGLAGPASTAWGNLAAMQLAAQGLDARDAVQRSLALAERSGDPSVLAWALLRVAGRARGEDQFLAADAALRRALPHAREAGALIHAQVLLQAGALWRLLGWFDEARDALRQAELLSREAGDVVGLALVWCRQAVLAATTGDLPGARRLASAAAELHARAGDRAMTQGDHLVLALVSLEEGRTDDAAAQIASLRAEATARSLQQVLCGAAAAASPMPEARAALAQAAALGADPSLLAVGEAWLAWRSGEERRARELLEGLPERVDETVEALARALRQRLPAAERAEDALRLELRYETVHLHRAGRPVVVIAGNAARIVTELAQMDAPAPWSLLARAVWGEVDEVSLRRRWDTTLWRLRARLREEGVRSSLLHTDRRGNVELVLTSADVIDDRS
jgi:predicted ATPase